MSTELNYIPRVLHGRKIDKINYSGISMERAVNNIKSILCKQSLEVPVSEDAIQAALDDLEFIYQCLEKS